MKKAILTLVLLSLTVPTEAQTVNEGNVVPRVQQLEDKAALKHLVDTFSAL